MSGRAGHKKLAKRQVHGKLQPHNASHDLSQDSEASTSCGEPLTRISEQTLGEGVQGTHKDNRGLRISLSNQEVCRESLLREANNPLEMADAEVVRHCPMRALDSQPSM